MPAADSNPLTARLAGTRFGPVEHFAEIDSTNRHLLDAARRGDAASGAVAVADVQSAGRGRLGRTWSAPPGGSLLVSVLLHTDLEPSARPLLTLTAGIAAIEAVAECTAGAVRPGLKWPNDLVVGDRKLAGLLAEAAADAVVVGMGLNLAWPTIPDELAAIATTLELAGADPVPARDDLLVAWLGRWHGWLAIASAPAGADRVVAAATAHSATLGRTVRVELAGSELIGVAEAIGPEGHLQVRVGTELHEVAAGDVVHLRAHESG